jgi:hypothetical protein
MIIKAFETKAQADRYADKRTSDWASIEVITMGGTWYVEVNG